MVHDDQRGRPEDQRVDESPLAAGQSPGNQTGADEERQIREDDGKTLEDNDRFGVVTQVSDVDDARIDDCGGNREEELEVGEERGVVEGPGAGGVDVPLRDGEGGGEGEPVAVHLKVRAAVGGGQKDLHAGGGAPEPDQIGHGCRRRVHRRGDPVVDDEDQLGIREHGLGGAGP